MRLRLFFLAFALGFCCLSLHAQGRRLSFGIGTDDFRTPFLENSDVNGIPGTPIYAQRLHLELAYERDRVSGFLMRFRGVMDVDRFPYHTLGHQNYLRASVWRYGGGTQLGGYADFGISKASRQNRFGIQAGAGLGLLVLVNGGGWIDGIQTPQNGDPIYEDILETYSGSGAAIQPFLALTYQPCRFALISLEQRHEFSGLWIHGTGTRHYYNSDTGSHSDVRYAWNTSTTAISGSYMPPVLRISWIISGSKNHLIPSRESRPPKKLKIDAI